jgi:hypothetical protein
MQLKEYAVERPAEEVKPAPSPSGNATRNQDASAFVSASRATIARLLSNDSQKFLSQDQQQGGE